MIESMTLEPPGAKSGMIGKLEKAKDKFEEGDIEKAIDSLNKFKGRVDHWNGHIIDPDDPDGSTTLTDEQAAELKAAASQIINCLELNCFSDE